MEENIGRTLFDINCSNILFDPSPRIMKVKAKINQWDLIRLKIFAQQRKPLNKQMNKQSNKKKKQPTEWEKLFANKETNKGLISKICKHLMELYVKMTTTTKTTKKID